jgi:hypothetical protein
MLPPRLTKEGRQCQRAKAVEEVTPPQEEKLSVTPGVGLSIKTTQ